MTYMLRILLIGMLLSTLTGCEKNTPSTAIDLRFMAAEQTGAWYALAVGITQSMKKDMSDLGNISILPGGGISNAVGVNAGQAQLGFSQAASIVDARNGVAPFTSPATDLRYLLTLFPHKTHIVVRADSGIMDIESLRGRRINVGPRGLLGEDIARRILDSYGMGYDDMASVQNLSFSDSVVEMKDGRLDALFWTSPIPFAVLTDLAQSEAIRLLPLPADRITALTASNPGLEPGVIRAGTYEGVDVDTPTLQSPLVLIAHVSADEELVGTAVRSVIDHLDNLRQVSPYLADVTRADLYRDYGVPTHPAALDVLREAGLLR